MNIEFNKETCSYQINLDHFNIWTIKRSLEDRLEKQTRILNNTDDEELKPYFKIEVEKVKELLNELNKII